MKVCYFGKPDFREDIIRGAHVYAAHLLKPRHYRDVQLDIYTDDALEPMAGFTHCISTDRPYVDFEITLSPRGKPLLTLAHEMVHVKQIAAEQLKVLPGIVNLWKGERVSAPNMHNRSLPWEAEAYSKERSVYELYTG